jgi:UDP:flavonoid glycosyltransferase YjiC (YdhE family)
VRVEPFLPHYYLLPHVDVMVTNGGYGGVQMALANGVPLVVAGATEEKPEVAAHVAYAGVGINLKTLTPTPEQLRRAIHEVLRNPRYTQRAQELQREYAIHHAPQQAADLIEQLIRTTCS